MRARAHALSSIAGVSVIQLIGTTVARKPITDLVHVTSDPKEQIGIYAMIIIGTLMGSRLPDIDAKWKHFHRTFTHTVWFLALIGYLWQLTKGIPQETIQSVANPMTLGVLFGSAFHIIGDAYSVQGVDFIWPTIGYRRYQSGAVVVKGRRTLTPPLYKVGTKPFGIQASVWWSLVTIPLFILSLQSFF